jgi:hypothetical protein
MNELTKEQRNEIYKMALLYLEADYKINKKYFRGLCWQIMLASDKLELFFASPFKNIPNFRCFPEIQKHEPNEHGCYWFEISEFGIHKRIKILQQAIEETN